MLARRGLVGDIREYDCYFIVANTVLVYIVEHTKVTSDIIKKILSILNGIEHVIIIHAKSITPDAKNAVSTKVVTFETWTFNEMSYDIEQIIPKHVKLLEKPNEWKKLPIILTTDYASRYYNFKRNDVIKITDGDEITYRRCV